MADISALGNLVSSEPLDLDTYEPEKVPFRLPAKGEYVVQAPDSFTFKATNEGNLSAQVDPTIVGPTNEGFEIRFIRVSNKSFPGRNGVVTSQVKRYLQACGFTGRLETPQQIADAVESTAGKTYKVLLDWRAYDADGDFKLQGMEKFTSDGNGGFLPWTTHPTAKDEKGEPKRVFANLNVVRWIPASV